MAQTASQPATTVAGQKLLITRGDGGQDGPGGAQQFAEPIGLITKDFTQSAAVGTTSVPDAVNTENPMWDKRRVKSMSAKVTGDGVCARESFAVWQGDVGQPSRPYRIKLDDDAMGYWEGNFILTQFQLTGTYGEEVKVKVTLDSDGPAVYTANQ
jgi:hypothetical protein